MTLEADSEYVLGGYRLPGVAYSSRDTDEGIDFVVSASFDVIEERGSSEFGNEASIEYPSFVFNSNQAFIGPNLLFNVVPEPTAFALAAIVGFAGPCRSLRRRSYERTCWS